MSLKPKTYDFGFIRVGPEEKTKRVKAVFDSVAPRYDVMNDLMSFGLHRVWKDAVITWLRPRTETYLVDLAGGTGDIAFRFLKAGGGAVTVADINSEMLAVGRHRAKRFGHCADINWLCLNAERIPLPDMSVDAVVCAFGIRNMTHIKEALSEIHRILKPGGRFICLEFASLAVPGVEQIYDYYSFKVVPLFGSLITKDARSYQYLVESIRCFPNQEAFSKIIKNIGFINLEVQNLCGGIAAIYSTWRI